MRHRAAIMASPLRRAGLICLIALEIIPANQSLGTLHFLHSSIVFKGCKE